MDAQGRGQAGDIDPADQWVFDPDTGSYVLRLEPVEQSAPASASPVGAGDRPGAGGPSGGRRGLPEDRRRDLPEQRGRRRAAGSSSRRKRKAKKSKAKKALYWGSGTLAFLLVGGSVAAYLVYQHLNGNIKKVDVGEKNAPVSDGPMNILVMGTDKREGKGNEGYGDAGSVGHADTTLLFHVSADRTNATALSIPRDLITDIPDCPTKQEDGTTRLIPGAAQQRFNTSLGQSGRDPGCTWRTVEKMTGLDIDHFMMADFNAVKALSSAVGGVDVCLAHDINDEKSHLKLSEGRHTIEGEEALAFVRTRHGVGYGSDLDRIKLQQQFLSSMMRKMKASGTFTNPGKMWKLANSATKALTVDTGIGTVKKLTELAKNLSKVDLKNVTFVTVPVVDNTDGATVVLNKPKAEALFSMVREDVSLTEVKRKEKAAKDEQAAKLRGPKAPAASVRVTVLNGSGQFGAAQETVDWMQNTEGMLLTGNGGNAPRSLGKTTLEYAPNQADQARRLADSMGLPAAALKESAQDAPPKTPMTLTLGADFKGAGTPITAPAKAPEGIQKVEASDRNVCAK
ncbi:LCP family protein [Streptomyces sp. B1866]|uniref:LCP family protein n=1 Tax=Streptomyces sp. B1866 TaxID=3075431 RepID=UPI0028923F5A|nr:LCP family protein [Streptomyces sp. B1866]MDT3398849.1 LCP family protein [Streptomyces sp. B1866]